MCCGGILLIGVLIYLPIFLVRKGFDLAVGCFGNFAAIIFAGVLLFIYFEFTEADICQLWLFEDSLCVLWAEIQLQMN